jgi:hypothetical protein
MEGISSNTLLPFILRTADTLKASYEACTVKISGAEDYNLVGFEVNYIKGSSDSMYLVVDTSVDGINYYRQSTETTSGAEVDLVQAYRTFAATGLYSFEITPIRTKFIKVSVKGMGASLANSNCTMTAYLTNA